MDEMAFQNALRALVAQYDKDFEHALGDLINVYLLELGGGEDLLVSCMQNEIEALQDAD